MAVSRQVRLLLGCCGLLAGCSTQKPVAPGPVEVPVVELTRADTTVSRSYVADIQSTQNVEIRARLQGYLSKIYIDEGQAVRQGQLLFQIDPTEFRIALQKADADVASAQADAHMANVELQRVKTLVAKKVISASEAELGAAKVRAAQAAVSRAEAARAAAAAHLAYTAVRAPFDGIIDRIPLKTGSLVEEGALLTTLSDNRSMYAYFNVSENEYLRQHQPDAALYAGKEVQLQLSDGSQKPYSRFRTGATSTASGPATRCL